MIATEQELITLTVDDQEVSVPPGTNLVETAKELGTEVPVFCYHSRLPVVGACRMCLVAVELPPRPGTPPDAPAPPPQIMTGCTTTVMPGMKVWTDTEAVLKYREGIVEFLLINHPLDCPVCDAGGECPLQDNSHDWGPKESRFVEQKRLLRKVHDLSPLVVLDQERCIVCYRCTRFMDDVAGEHELDFFDRGYNSVLGTLDDRPLQSKFHGNIIDLCPCGALTSDTYRFRARPGDLQTTRSVCAQCPVGCNLKLDTRRNEMVRVRAQENTDINDIWLCNKGEFTFEFVSTDQRLRSPLVKRDGALAAVEWDEALTEVATKIKSIRDEHGAAAIGVIGGRNIPNEDAFALREFARSVIGTPAPRSSDRRPRRRAAARGQPSAYPDAGRRRPGRGSAAARYRPDQRPAGAVAAAAGCGDQGRRQVDRRQPARYRAGPDCLPSPATPARHRSGPVAGAIGRRPRTGAEQRRSSRRRGGQSLAGASCRAYRRHGRDDPGGRRHAGGGRQRAGVRRPTLQPPVGSGHRGRGRLQPRAGNGQQRWRRDLHPGGGERPGGRGARRRARPGRTTGRGDDRSGPPPGRSSASIWSARTSWRHIPTAPRPSKPWPTPS